jgi:hypothetical protein
VRPAICALLLAGCAGSAPAEAPAPPPAPAPEAVQPAGEPAKTTDGAELAGFRVRVIERETACWLVYEGGGTDGVLRSALAPPCRLVRRPSGEPEWFRYDDIEPPRAVAVLVGTPDARDDASRPGAPVYCGSAGQGVLLSEGGVALSLRVARGRLCANGLDEKEYWLFAH